MFFPFIRMSVKKGLFYGRQLEGIGGVSSDYDDFYIAGRAEAEEQLKNAKLFVQRVEDYVRLAAG